MINLIPKEEKKRMKTDFYYRLFGLFFSVFAFSLVLASLFLLPAYFISSAKIPIMEIKLNAEKNGESSAFYEKSIALVKEINTKLDLIEKEKLIPSTRVFQGILQEKRADIKITQILYENEASGKRISVTGIAPSREILLLFRLALENSPSFKNVDLPISNFVKGSDIQFNLNLTPS
jgi:hypothetical protein